MIASKRKQIELAAAKGRTVENAGIIWGSTKDVVLVAFTDGTFAAVEAIPGYDDDATLQETFQVDFEDALRVNPLEAHKAGFLSEKEMKRMQAESQAAIDANTEIRERETLERLLKKYGAP